MKFLLKNKQKEISFYETNHEYFYKGQKFKSVSSYVAKFSHPFDPTGEILTNCARRDGITEGELQAKWDEIKDKACDKGTRIHEEHELMLQGIGYPSEFMYNLMKKWELLDTETIIFDERFKLAGQCDGLLYNGTVWMIDFKTNKNLTQENPYNQFMLPPYDFLPDTPYGHYTLQLNVYRTMLESGGIPVEKMSLVYITDTYKLIPIKKIEVKLGFGQAFKRS